MCGSGSHHRRRRRTQHRAPVMSPRRSSRWPTRTRCCSARCWSRGGRADDRTGDRGRTPGPCASWLPAAVIGDRGRIAAAAMPLMGSTSILILAAGMVALAIGVCALINPVLATVLLLVTMFTPVADPCGGRTSRRAVPDRVSPGWRSRRCCGWTAPGSVAWPGFGRLGGMVATSRGTY